MHISTVIVFVSIVIFVTLSQIPSAQSCNSKTGPVRPRPRRTTTAKPSPAKPGPAKPGPGKPSPGKLSPGKPTPGKPTPGKPTLGKPTPGKPTPGKPTLEKPNPGKPRSDPNSKCTPCRKDCQQKFQNPKFSRKELADYPFARGVEAGEKDFPWVATLHTNNAIFCAATIISSRHLLTAAQCIDGYPGTRYRIEITAGAFDRFMDINAKKYKVDDLIMHPKYERGAIKPYNIAMVRVVEPIDFSTPYIQPACLPRLGSRDYTGYIGVVAHWGLKGRHPNEPNALQRFELPILSNEHCKKVTSLNPGRISSHTFCAGFPNEDENTCMGDEGGVIHLLGSNPMEVIGVITPNRNCSKTPPPALYVRISTFLPWIQETAGNECLCRV